MRRLINAFAIVALITPVAAAHAEPTVPDFGAYPESQTDYQIYDSAHTCNHTKQLCGAFYTQSGFICALRATHIGYTLDCRGPKPRSASTTLRISAFGVFEESPAEAADSDRSWLGQPVRLLPPRQRIGALQSTLGFSCVTDETQLLACALGSGGKPHRGFSVTQSGYYSFIVRTNTYGAPAGGYAFETH